MSQELIDRLRAMRWAVGSDCGLITVPSKDAPHTCIEAADHIADLQYRLAEAEAKLAEAKKDAERYLILRDFGVSEGLPIRDCLVVYRGVDSDTSLLPDELDAAIDAAKENKCL